MGYHQQCATRLLKVALQVLDNVDVEVVCGLVHHEEVGLLQKHKCYGCTLGFATRQLAHRLIQACELHRGEHLLDALLDTPAVGSIHRCHCALDLFLVTRGDGLLV